MVLLFGFLMAVAVAAVFIVPELLVQKRFVKMRPGLWMTEGGARAWVVRYDPYEDAFRPWSGHIHTPSGVKSHRWQEDGVHTSLGDPVDNPTNLVEYLGPHPYAPEKDEGNAKT